MAKSERVNARISVENKIKLDSYCRYKGITLSHWITDRIELMRYEVPNNIKESESDIEMAVESYLGVKK